jgi:hypothetical protein
MAGFSFKCVFCIVWSNLEAKVVSINILDIFTVGRDT